MNHRHLFIIFILISVLSCSFSCTQAAPIEIDQWIKADLSNEETYGAVIAIVKDGRIQHLSGYGSADKEGEWPLDPKTTRIPIGSITKLFTWEALEQLIHDGHIEPEADLNNYLPYPVFRIGSEPITAPDLITHTTGLDERITGIFTRDLSEISTPFDLFVKIQPEQIRSPGTIAAYSNTGALLAGAVIEEVSGLRYPEYISENILLPYGMHHTAFDPIPNTPEISSPGIISSDGSRVFLAYQPAGGASSTAEDMAQYMIHHLETRNFSQIFTHDTRLPGITEGGYFELIRGDRILLHGGDVPGASSLLALIPEKKLGIFIWYSGSDGSARRDAFLSRFFPGHLPDLTGYDRLPGSKHRYSGLYISTRSPEKSFEKIIRIMGETGQTVTVQGGDEEVIIGDERYLEVEPGYFLGINNPGSLVFTTSYGEEWLFMGDTPSVAWKKAAGYEYPMFHQSLLILFAGFFLSTFCIGLIRARSDTYTQTWLLISSLSLLAVIFLLLLFGSIRISGLLYGLPPLFGLVLLVPLLLAGLTGVLVWWLMSSREGRIFLVIIVLYLAWLSYWNLLIPF